jgi:hypothetical protein
VVFAAGNGSGVATRTFVWDTIAPVASVTAPAKTTNRRPVITFSGTDADDQLGVGCKLDDVAVPCAGGTFTPSSDLALGKHTFWVRYTDRAGNVGTPVTAEVVVEAPPVVVNPQPQQQATVPAPVITSQGGGEPVAQPSANDNRGVTAAPTVTQKPAAKKKAGTPAVCKTIKRKKGAARKRAIKACAKKKAAAKKRAAKKARR